MLPPVNEDVRLHPAFQLHILADIEVIWSSSFRVMAINPPLPSGGVLSVGMRVRPPLRTVQLRHWQAVLHVTYQKVVPTIPPSTREISGGNRDQKAKKW